MDRTLVSHLLSLSLATVLTPVSFSFADTPTHLGETLTEAPAKTASEPAASECSHVPVRLFRYDSYPDAWTAAQESNKPILVYICMPNCPHCNRMLTQTFTEPAVNDMVSDSYESLQAHRYVHKVLIERLHVRWYPTTVLVGPNNKVLDMIEGYVDAGKFKSRLQLGLARAHETSQTR